MSGALYFQNFVPDSLDGDDDLDARGKFVLSELERMWDSMIDDMIQETRSLSQRFEHYKEQCESAKRNRWKTSFNPIGELQGVTYRFDALAKGIRDIEDTIDGVRNILYPEADKKAPVKSSGATNRPRRRPSAGKGKK
jgi:hypothetical protein